MTDERISEIRPGASGEPGFNPLDPSAQARLDRIGEVTRVYTSLTTTLPLTADTLEGFMRKMLLNPFSPGDLADNTSAARIIDSRLKFYDPLVDYAKSLAPGEKIDRQRVHKLLAPPPLRAGTQRFFHPDSEVRNTIEGIWQIGREVKEEMDAATQEYLRKVGKLYGQDIEPDDS